MDSIEYYVDTHYPLFGINRDKNTIIDDYDLNNCVFMANKIRDYIKSNKHNETSYIHMSLIHCKIYSYSDTHDYEIEEICLEIKRIHDFVIKEYNCRHIQKEFSFILYLTPFKKTLNYYKENKENKFINDIIIEDIIKNKKDIIYNFDIFTNPLDFLHINSGQTNGNIITIWRKEEWQKVFMHELIHLYNLEKQSNFDISKILNFPIKMSNNFPLFPKELFTELQAWYLYVLYYNRNIKEEQIHSIKNTCLIFKKYGINNIKDLNNHIINASSSALFYHILKGIFLFKIDLIYNLLKPLNKWNGNMYDIFENIINDPNYINYINSVLSNISIPEYRCKFTSML